MQDLSARVNALLRSTVVFLKDRNPWTRCVTPLAFVPSTHRDVSPTLVCRWGKYLGRRAGFLRSVYETALVDAQGAVSQAKTLADNADVALTLERSQALRCKLDLDKLRLETHGKLVALLADKNEADAFFRPAVHASNEAAID